MSDFELVAIMPRRYSSCWLFVLLLLTACSNEPVQNKAQLEVRPSKTSPKAKPQANVQTYRMPENKNSQHILDANTQIQAGDSQAAQKALDMINVTELSPEQLNQYKLTDAQIALSIGDAERALHKLEGMRPKLMADADQINYYQSLAFVHALLGDVLPSVRARIRLGQLLQNPEQQKQNIIAILDTLSVLPLETLNSSTSVADELAGWMALAKILKQHALPGFDVSSQVQQWRQSFPNHPANADYLLAYLRAPQLESSPADNSQATTASTTADIAVLLPNSGPYAPASKAIKEGLQVAHRLAASNAPQLPLKFYDSEQGEIVDLYRRAVAEGAKQVIGPLVKEQIQTLAQNAELSVPVLALNHVDNLSKPNLYQFGLSPIDEAEQLALKARRDGLQQAVLLVPDTPQGQRIGHYLSSAWQANGGQIAAIENYDPKQHDFGVKLKTLLSPSVSINGQKQSLAVFVSANPELSRELAPQLKFQKSGEIAVYAMPNIYSGRPNPTQDAELGNISFCDIPWLFANTYSGALSQSALQNSWQTLSDSQIRLLALGLDAYNLVGQLGQLSASNYSGATGRLGLNGENRITRKLVCAQFKGGVPVASGFTE